jgi:5-formyltetrahydrofolate cyclo-ligase
MENHEIETDEIIAAAFRENKRVFLPRIVDLNESQALYSGHRKELEMIEVAADEIAALEPSGPYKLREPALGGTTALEAGGLDAIIVPGLGFTQTCHRLGHGKGFYDTYIAKHIAWGASQGRPAPFLIGIGATEQFIDTIPTEGHDYVLDAVVAGDGAIYIKQ